MYLKRFVFVNWGNVPNGEFEFGPLNLFSGASGSGKTTAADAIQTIMTAAKSNLFNYNPGQDETTQKGKGGKQVRTLSSYVLGCDDGSFARTQLTDGYLAALFHPSQGEPADPFVALIGVRADLDSAGKKHVAREIDAKFMILPFRHDFNIHDVIESNPARVMPLDRVVKQLKAIYGSSKSVEEYSTKKGYLSRLYGALRGRHTSLSEREANAAAKAFSRFMAYKPVASINDFVASEILDKRDLGEAISNISSMMKTINAMEQDAKRINDAIDGLELANREANHYIDNWIKFNSHTLTLHQAKFLQGQQRYRQEKLRCQELKEAITANEDATVQLKNQYKELSERVIDLTAKRRGYAELQQKDNLLKSLDTQQEKLVQSVKQLLLQDNQVKKNIETAQALLRYLGDEWLVASFSSEEIKQSQKLAKSVANSKAWKQLDYQTLLTNDWVDIKPFQDFLEPAQKTQIEHQKLWQFLFEHPGEVGVNTKPPIDKLRRLRDQKQETAAQLQRQRKQFDVEIERLESNHKVRYPHAVNEAIAAITKMVKGSKPRVLCDFVEVNDERWQTAIEGYLGGNRFAIIVEPEHEAQAIKVVRNLKGKNTSKVIQTAKAKQDAERFSLSEDSIIHVMEFTHAAIKDFVIASYGNVSRVETTEELRQTRRGVTPEAIGSGNYAMFRCDVDDADLVFGKAARIRSLVAKKEGIDNCLIELHQTQEQFQNLVEIVQHLEAFHSLKIANEVNLLLDYYRETQAIQTQINDLDLSRFEDLEKTITDVQEKQGEIREHIDKHLKTHGQLETQLKDSERKKSNFSKEQDNLALEVEKSEENIDATTKVWNHVDADDLINQAKVFAKKVNIKKLEENDVKTAFEAISKNRYSLINALREHNQISNSSEAIPITLDVGDLPNHQQFTKICKIQLGIDSTLILLKANKLVEKQDSISKLKKTFDNTFVDHLCGVIHQAVKEGERVLEDLNEELKRHQFGQEKETYRFHWEFMPDFKEYWDFFEEVRQFPIGDGTTLFDLKLSKKSKQVRDKLLNMLLDDDDEARAIRELERLADYRNYRHYEIYKEVPGKEPIALSQYGTGSGGQLETPAYIIRAAAITSALQYNQPGAHLRTVLVDEAFSKMDEARSRSVINYLTQSLGLQVIFIMPSKASGPFLDMISHQFVFAKYPLAAGQTNGQLKTAVFVDRKESHQDKVQALWAQHKETIYEQASLDFMEELFKEEADVLNKSSK